MQRADLRETILRQQLELSRVDKWLRNKKHKEKEREEREAQEQKARQEKKEKKRQAKAERKARKQKLKEQKRQEREKVGREAREQANREAGEQTETEAKEIEEEEKKSASSKISSVWDSTVEKNNDRSRKTPGLAQKGQKNQLASAWDFCSVEKKGESPGLSPTITSSVPGGIFDGANNFDFFPKKDSPGGGAEIRTPLQKEGTNGIDTPSNLSKVTVPSQTVDTGILEDSGPNHTSTRVTISSENERFTDAERDPSPPEPAHPTFTPEDPTIPKPWPTSLAPAQPQVSASSENERFTDAERGSSPPALAPEVPITPKPWPIPSTTPTQPQVSTPAPAPRTIEPEKPLSLWDHKKLKAAVQPAPVPAQKSSGWGTWGEFFLRDVSSAVADSSPSPVPVLPKIEDPPRGSAPNQPSKGQPAGFGSLNKPAWGGAGGLGDNPWGGAKNRPTPIPQKTSTGPAWGAKPVGGFGPGTTAWGNTGSGIKNLTVNTTTKPPECSPNAFGLEHTPESVVETKHVPAPAVPNNLITDEGVDANSKPTTPIEEEPEIDWVGTWGKKKGQAASLARMPSVPNTPDPDNADGGALAGGGRKKKKGKGGR